MSATISGTPKMDQTLANRANNLGFRLEEEDDIISLYSGELVAFVGDRRAVNELLRDMEKRRAPVV